jgi:hypothetical protein
MSSSIDFFRTCVIKAHLCPIASRAAFYFECKETDSSQKLFKAFADHLTKAYLKECEVSKEESLLFAQSMIEKLEEYFRRTYNSEGEFSMEHLENREEHIARVSRMMTIGDLHRAAAEFTVRFDEPLRFDVAAKWFDPLLGSKFATLLRKLNWRGYASVEFCDISLRVWLADLLAGMLEVEIDKTPAKILFELKSHQLKFIENCPVEPWHLEMAKTHRLVGLGKLMAREFGYFTLTRKTKMDKEFISTVVAHLETKLFGETTGSTPVKYAVVEGVANMTAAFDNVATWGEVLDMYEL